MNLDKSNVLRISLKDLDFQQNDLEGESLKKLFFKGLGRCRKSSRMKCYLPNSVYRSYLDESGTAPGVSKEIPTDCTHFIQMSLSMCQSHLHESQTVPNLTQTNPRLFQPYLNGSQIGSALTQISIRLSQTYLQKKHQPVPFLVKPDVYPDMSRILTLFQSYLLEFRTVKSLIQNSPPPSLIQTNPRLIQMSSRRRQLSTRVLNSFNLILDESEECSNLKQISPTRSQSQQNEVRTVAVFPR